MSRKTNKLITVELGEVPGKRSAAVLLMGMVNTLTNERVPKGCVLIITANPLGSYGPMIPMKGLWGRSKGQNMVPNRVRMEGLFLTDSQKEVLARYRSRTDEGYVYLYTGVFFLQPDVQVAQQDVLYLLADHLNWRVIEFQWKPVPFQMADLEQVIRTRKVGGCIREGRIGKRRDRVEVEGEGEGKPKGEEVFRLRQAGEQIFVDLEGPSVHRGYNLQVLLLQTMKCKMKAKTSVIRREIIRIADEKTVCVCPGYRVGNLPRIWTLCRFKYPSKEEENAVAGGERRQLCDGIKVVDINYDVQVVFKEKDGSEKNLNFEDSGPSSSTSLAVQDSRFLDKFVIMGLKLVDALEEICEDEEAD